MRSLSESMGVARENLELGQVTTSGDINLSVVEIGSPICVCSDGNIQGKGIGSSAQIGPKVEEAIAWPAEVSRRR